MEMISALQTRCEGIEPEDSLHNGPGNMELWCIFVGRPDKFLQAVELLVIWDAMTLMWNYNVNSNHVADICCYPEMLTIFADYGRKKHPFSTPFLSKMHVFRYMR